MLKAEEQEMSQLLQYILQDVWDNEVIPNARKRGTIQYVEMLKAEEQEMSQLLQHILQDVWDNEVIPNARKRGTIISM